MAIDKDKIINIEDRSYFFQDILEKTPAWIIRWGNTVFFVLFFLLLSGLWLIEYPDVILAKATILTENPSIAVYSKRSGQIAHILKEDKAPVQKGDWVLILDNSAAYQSVVLLKDLVDSLDGADFWEQISKVQLNDRLQLGNLNDEYVNLIRHISEYQLFKRLNPQFSQIGINNNRSERLDEILQNLTRQKRLLEQEIDLVYQDYKRSQELWKEKAVARLEVEQKERQWLGLKSQVEELNSAMLKAQLEQQVIHKENSSLMMEQSDRYLQLRNNILSSFNQLLFLLREWEQNNVLLAPVDGILNMYDVRALKQFLSQEQHVFTISPMGEQHYYAWVKMPVDNSGKVTVGQQVIIKLANYPYQEFGMLRGMILSITNVPKDGHYLLKVDLPRQLVTSANIELEGKQELMGQAEIITENLSMLSRMFNFLNSK